jgi:hypothetical protein
VEAAHFRGQFEPFRNRADKIEWRKKLSGDLMEILKKNVYRKFGCSVINHALNNFDPKIAEEFSLNAFSLAGRTTEKRIREWIIKEWSKTTPVAIIFEAGDQGKGKLQTRLSEDGCFPATFMPKKDTVLEDGTVQRGYIPLQAADWLAYESSIAVRQMEDGADYETTQLRWPMREFMDIPGELGTYTPDDIRELERNLTTLHTPDAPAPLT